MNQILIFKYAHFPIIALAYAVVACVAMAMVNPTMGVSAYFGVVVAVALLVVMGAWTALGSGGLLFRATVSVFLCWMVVVGGLVGNYLDPSNAGGLVGEGWFWRVVVIAILLTPVMCVAAQIPFWIIRGIAGWRLVHVDDHPKSSLSLGELFAILLLFSIAFATPQFASNLIAEWSVAEIRVGNVHYRDVPQPDGTRLLDPVELDKQNVDEYRAEALRDAKTGTFMGVLVYSLILLAVSLLCVPGLWFLLKFSPVNGWLLWLLYALLFINVIGLCLNMSVSGWASQLATVIWYLSIYGLTFAVALALPLAISRTRKIKLLTRKDLKAICLVDSTPEHQH